MNQSKVDQAWALFQALMRQYPLWPSTFSTCDCQRGMARGAGKCAMCIREELAAIVGMPLADRAENALIDVTNAWHEISDIAKDDE